MRFCPNDRNAERCGLARRGRFDRSVVLISCFEFEAGNERSLALTFS